MKILNKQVDRLKDKNNKIESVIKDLSLENKKNMLITNEINTKLNKKDKQIDFLHNRIKTVEKLILLNSSRKKLKKIVMQYHWSKLIKQSGEFDITYYLDKHPDVKKSNIDPIKHYILYGADEGRNPSSQFSTVDYMINNPDTIKKGINPLVHYILSRNY